MMLTLPMPVTLMVGFEPHADGNRVTHGVDGSGDDGAEDGYHCASGYDGSGRVALRPGYPVEPAARSRPFGRVSLAPPLPAVAARRALVPAPLRTLPPGSPASIPPSLMPLVAGSPTAGAV